MTNSVIPPNMDECSPFAYHSFERRMEHDPFFKMSVDKTIKQTLEDLKASYEASRKVVYD